PFVAAQLAGRAGLDQAARRAHGTLRVERRAVRGAGAGGQLVPPGLRGVAEARRRTVARDFARLAARALAERGRPLAAQLGRAAVVLIEPARGALRVEAHAHLQHGAVAARRPGLAGGLAGPGREPAHAAGLACRWLEVVRLHVD